MKGNGFELKAIEANQAPGQVVARGGQLRFR